MSILELPVETVCNIFLIAIRNPLPLRGAFVSGDSFQNIFALVDISRVCRVWREIALGDPTLWTTLFICLTQQTEFTAHNLRQATFYNDILLERWKQLPLTCSISVSNVEDLQLSHPLIHEIVRHEARWEKVQICVSHPTDQPGTLWAVGHDPEALSLSSKISLGSVEMPHLKELRLNHVSWYDIAAMPSCPSLTILDLSGLRSAYEIWTWLSRTPHLIELKLTLRDTEAEHAMTEINEEDKAMWHITLEKLKILDVLLPVLPLLTCSVLDKFVLSLRGRAARLDADNYHSYFRDFNRRNPTSLQTLEIQSYIFRRVFDVYLLQVSTIRTMSYADFGGSWCGTLPRLLSIKNDDDDLFQLLPELEHVEFIDWNAFSLSSFIHFVTARWNVRDRRLKTVKVTRCRTYLDYIRIPSFNIDSDLATLSDVWEPLQKCVKEGLLLEIIPKG